MYTVKLAEQLRIIKTRDVNRTRISRVPKIFPVPGEKNFPNGNFRVT